MWPRLRAVVTDADEVAILDAMQHEHELLDPLVDASAHHSTSAAAVRSPRTW